MPRKSPATPARVTALLRQCGPLTTREIARLLDCSPSGYTFVWTLRSLVEQGSVVKLHARQGYRYALRA